MENVSDVPEDLLNRPTLPVFKKKLSKFPTVKSFKTTSVSFAHTATSPTKMHVNKSHLFVMDITFKQANVSPASIISLSNPENVSIKTVNSPIVKDFVLDAKITLKSTHQEFVSSMISTVKQKPDNDVTSAMTDSMSMLKEFAKNCLLAANSQTC